jgi:hypothetical protein
MSFDSSLFNLAFSGFIIPELYMGGDCNGNRPLMVWLKQGELVEKVGKNCGISKTGPE